MTIFLNQQFHTPVWRQHQQQRHRSGRQQSRTTARRQVSNTAARSSMPPLHDNKGAEKKTCTANQRSKATTSNKMTYCVGGSPPPSMTMSLPLPPVALSSSSQQSLPKHHHHHHQHHQKQEQQQEQKKEMPSPCSSSSSSKEKDHLQMIIYSPTLSHYTNKQHRRMVSYEDRDELESKLNAFFLQSCDVSDGNEQEEYHHSSKENDGGRSRNSSNKRGESCTSCPRHPPLDTTSTKMGGDDDLASKIPTKN